MSAEINGKEIMRSYTPTSSDDDLGHFDLLVKVCPHSTTSTTSLSVMLCSICMYDTNDVVRVQ